MQDLRYSETLSRIKFKFSSMYIKDGAKVFIKNKKLGKYLFFLRDNKITIPNPNTYDILGGGIEVGEQPIEALKRELQEETNICIYDIVELGIGIFTSIIKDEVGEKTITSKFFVFLAQTDAILDEAELYEGQKLEYFTIDEALNQNNLSLPIREAINEYEKKLI